MVVQLVGDLLNCYLHLGDSDVVEGLGVPQKVLPRVLEQHQDTFHIVSWYVAVDAPMGISLAEVDFVVLEDAVI